MPPRCAIMCLPPQDITPRELVRANAKVDREVVLYGYLRGSAIKDAQRVHIAGAGDFTVQVRYERC